MRHFIAMTLVALAPMLAGCEYFIPSFAGHGGGGMKEYAEISISVADMDVSLPFYRRLGFDVIEEDRKPHRRVILSDNQIFLRLEQTPFDSPRLVYISSEAADRAERLQSMGMRPVEYRMPDGGTAKEFRDPNGIIVVLRHGRHPANRIWRHDPQIGQYGELSIETSDLARSVDFWEKLRFAPYPTVVAKLWPVFSDQALVIGLHESGSPGATAITYFCKDLDGCVRGLKAKGVVFAAEESDASGKKRIARLQAPDGQVFTLRIGQGPFGDAGR
jgi:catechol 2,3-dioxygenase-like lactoylglutathione lyase family enzyme